MATTFSGTTPATATLSPGTYTVTVTKDGYRTFTQTVTIADGETKTVNANLVEQFGTIEVTSVPTGATVSIEKQ